MNKEKSEIRVRFAPSPSGFLHIGSARTALFNWLYAKKTGGKFLLRIEDTDKKRSNIEIVQNIFSDLKWIGLDWDEKPIFQSNRIDIYKNYSNKLINFNKAYYCYCSFQKEIQTSNNLKIKRDYKYNGCCRNLTSKERQQNDEKKIPKVIRFKVEQGITKFIDIVHGSLKVDNKEIDDFIILRSDGTPTYQLAVVVDDIEMYISHVIRGDDHISNTAKQIMLYNAFQVPVPSFIHVPLILGSDKKRLSKRHGATSINEFKKNGYTNKALINYLALLGWSPGDNKEIMTITELVNNFDITRISPQNAVFDEKKLQWLNGEYINKLANSDIASLIIPGLIEKKYIESQDIDNQYLDRVIELIKPKIRLLTDFIDLGYYFFIDPVNFDEKARQKYWQEAIVVDRLTDLYKKLSTINFFNAELIEKELRDLANILNISAAKLIHPTRLALTGFSVSPGLFELMEVLGKTRVLKRIKKAIKILSNFK